MNKLLEKLLQAITFQKSVSLRPNIEENKAFNRAEWTKNSSITEENQISGRHLLRMSEISKTINENQFTVNRFFTSYYYLHFDSSFNSGCSYISEIINSKHLYPRKIVDIPCELPPLSSLLSLLILKY